MLGKYFQNEGPFIRECYFAVKSKCLCSLFGSHFHSNVYISLEICDIIDNMCVCDNPRL